MESNSTNVTTIKDSDFLWTQISELPYFRGLLRAVESKFYQDLTLKRPVLDVGCGDGHFAARTFAQKIDVGIDPWKGPLAEATARGVYDQTLESAGAEIPFPDETFETVISNSVLEHIPDLDPVITEISRVIKPGGLFVFCVPNHQFLGNLSVSNFLDRIYLKPLGNLYRAFFNRISRHYHCDAPDVWKKRLTDNGFELVRHWHYFSPKAFHVLEWGHYFGLPSLITRKLFGKWILFPNRTALAPIERLCRKYYEEPWEQEAGSYTFYIARKKA